MNDRPGPADYNRGPRRKKRQGDQDYSSWPSQLRIAYWIFVVGAVVMLTAGMVGLFGSYSHVTNTDLSVEQVDYIRFNTRFAALSNIVSAVVITACSAQLASGSVWARRIITAVSAYAMFVNVAALIAGVGGLLLLLMPMVLMVGIFFLFHPDSTAFIKARRAERA